MSPPTNWAALPMAQTTPDRSASQRPSLGLLAYSLSEERCVPGGGHRISARFAAHADRAKATQKYKFAAKTLSGAPPLCLTQPSSSLTARLKQGLKNPKQSPPAAATNRPVVAFAVAVVVAASAAGADSIVSSPACGVLLPAPLTRGACAPQHGLQLAACCLFRRRRRSRRLAACRSWATCAVAERAMATRNAATPANRRRGSLRSGCST
mmetsp:Transcript_20515/g.66144  ORF Transcript_20515/g.66144 Transcript_20515/m.66144 type:complete len:210 (-) Transcript_20515:412-1041(-)